MLQTIRHIRQWTCGLLLTLCTSAAAQAVADEILATPQCSAGILYSLPTGKSQTDTPAPDGKKPFYISHCGCSASYYQEDRKDYEAPIATLAKADSQSALTPLGKDVLRRLKLVAEDALQKSGELTDKGAMQIRQLAQEMAERFPDIFVKGCIIDARSIVRNHTIMTMQEAMMQLARFRSPMDLRMKSSHSNDSWMLVRDKELEADRFNKETEASFQAFEKANNNNNQRLMESLFVSDDYVKAHINTEELCKQLFLVASTIPNTALEGVLTLYDIFTPQEIYRFWRIQNAKRYISYGCCELNGGNQAYAQRAPLWNILHMGDSIMNQEAPVVHLRYSSRSMVMALICLMELDDFGLQTSNLDLLDKLGWADYRIAPFGSSVQVIHYRKDKNDDDILIKVLHNGKEARLPIATDCAPYYHWKDFKRYYLRKLYAHEKLRYANKKITD